MAFTRWRARRALRFYTLTRNVAHSYPPRRALARVLVLARAIDVGPIDDSRHNCLRRDTRPAARILPDMAKLNRAARESTLSAPCNRTWESNANKYKFHRVTIRVRPTRTVSHQQMDSDQKREPPKRDARPIIRPAP